MDNAALIKALNRETGWAWSGLHTGGGIVILETKVGGLTLWLDQDVDWRLGFYRFDDDPDDEGALVGLLVHDADNPGAVAEAVNALLVRAIDLGDVHA